MKEPTQRSIMTARQWTLVFIGIFSIVAFVVFKDTLLNKPKIKLVDNAPLAQSEDKALAQSKGKALAGLFQLNIDTNQGFRGVDLQSAQKIFSSYCTTPTAKCPNITRFGNKGDGGYEVCMSPSYIHIGNCIIYSFGIRNNWNFDDDARKKYGCEVHSFDPSINKEDHERAPKHYFHNLGLWDADMTNTDGWKLATLGTIIKQLGHSEKIVDVVKIDIEGAEWPFLRQFIHTEWPRQIRQLIFEIHTPTFAGTPMTVNDYQAVYNDLTTLRDKHDYQLYTNIHNNNCCGRFDTLTPKGMEGMRQRLCCYELYYINLNHQTP